MKYGWNVIAGSVWPEVTELQLGAKSSLEDHHLHISQDGRAPHPSRPPPRLWVMPYWNHMPSRIPGGSSRPVRSLQPSADTQPSGGPPASCVRSKYLHSQWSRVAAQRTHDVFGLWKTGIFNGMSLSERKTKLWNKQKQTLDFHWAYLLQQVRGLHVFQQSNKFTAT